MATSKRDSALSADEARRRIAETSFRTERAGAAERPGKLGLEPECFAIRTDAEGRPCGRAPLAGDDGVLAVLDELASSGDLLLPRPADQPPPPGFDLRRGGRVTFEPGAQIEHSTSVHDTGAGALDDAACVTEAFARAFAERGITLAFLGLDLWHDVDDVPMQLDAPRYRCMRNYFDKRSEGGKTMMRHTCSMQVNLDLGPPGVAEERWMLANLASPLATATFASSPKNGAKSARALAWQVLDVTRTGFPAPLVEGQDSDPVEHWTNAALSADVMIYFKEDGTSTCGEPGFSFGQWIEHGHEEIGWPTRDDLDYHLTTLFFEVRLRGFLELRAIEAVTPRWRAAPAVLFAGLLYDPEARNEALALLEPLRSELPGLWRRAARNGLEEPKLDELARSVWPLALEGAQRLPPDYFREEHVATAREFLEEFTLRRRAPVDDLERAVATGPAEALAWATLPAPCPGESSR